MPNVGSEFSACGAVNAPIGGSKLKSTASCNSQSQAANTENISVRNCAVQFHEGLKLIVSLWMKVEHPRSVGN